MPEDEYIEVMWYSGGSGGGTHSWALYGVSKVHLVRADDPMRRVLCGARSGRARRRSIKPAPTDERCMRCAKAAERG